jgi:hypothetical protein
MKKTDDAVAPPKSVPSKIRKESAKAATKSATASQPACSGTKKNESDAAQDDGSAIFAPTQGVIKDIGGGGEHNGKRTCRVEHFSPGDLLTLTITYLIEKNVGQVAVEVVPPERRSKRRRTATTKAAASKVIVRRVVACRCMPFVLPSSHLSQSVLKLGC